MGRARKPHTTNTPVDDANGSSDWAEDDRQFEILTSYLMTGESAEIYLDLIRDAHYGQREPRQKWQAAFLYSQGKTPDTIGRAMGVTRERIRQMVNSCHPHVSSRAIRHALHLVEEKEQHELSRRVHEWSYTHPGAPGEEAERLFCLDAPQLRGILRKRASLHYPLRRKSEQTKRWTDEDLIRLLRQWWEDDDEHTSDSFERWSLAHEGPTRQTPMNRFGGWNHALQRAGLETAHRTTRVRKTYSDEDIWAAVIEYFQSPRDSYTFRGFEEAGQETPGRPSAALARQRLNCSWNDMVETAQRVLSGNTDGLDPRWVAHVREPRHWPDFQPVTSSPERAREEACRALRRYMEENGDYVVTSRYAHWAQEHREMTVMTMIRSTGLSWCELVKDAGGQSGTSPRKRRYTEEELLNGLLEFFQQPGIVTTTRYRDYAREHGLASLSVVEAQYGTWAQACRVAHEVLDRR